MTSKARTLAIWAPILLILLTLPWYAPGYYTSLVITIMMWSILGVSWIIFSGYTGYISLAVVAFFGIGAYITAILWSVLPFFPLVIILGGLASMFFAFLIGFPFLRIRGPYFIILTLGLSELIKHIFEMYVVHIRQTLVIILMNVPSSTEVFYSLLVIAIIAAATAYFVKNSKFGLGLFSIRGNEEAAEAMGVDTTRYKLLAFSLSALFAGFVGVIMALRWAYVLPVVVFNPMITFQAVIMAIFGGMEDFRGPIIGAVVLTLISEALGIRYPYHYMILLGIILILIIKFLPTGLMGATEKLRLGKKSV